MYSDHVVHHLRDTDDYEKSHKFCGMHLPNDLFGMNEYG